MKLFLALLSFFIHLVQSQQYWNYDLFGYDMWPLQYPECDKNNDQSPIDINLNAVKADYSLKPFKFFNFEINYRWNISFDEFSSNLGAFNVKKFYLLFINLDSFINNNQKKVKMRKLDTFDTAKLFVIGGDLEPEPFFLREIKFQWGFNDYQGSEHLIDGIKYCLEMQLLLSGSANRTVAMAFLFQRSTMDNVNLDPFIHQFSKIQNNGDQIQLSIILSTMMPLTEKLERYLKYSGSLTNPPCTTGIDWYIFLEPIRISSKQLMNFRVNSQKNNLRELQPLKGRPVFISAKAPVVVSSAASHRILLHFSIPVVVTLLLFALGKNIS